MSEVFFRPVESTQVFTRLKKKDTSVVMAMNASLWMCSSAISIPIVQLHSSHHGNIQMILQLDPICLLSSRLQVLADSIIGPALK